MRLPDDPSLPFFAYGLFCPGELAYPLICEFVESSVKGEVDKAYFVRDALALLAEDRPGKTEGSVLHFRFDSRRSAYQKVVEIEPATQYRWGTAKIETEDGPVFVNVLFGKSPASGSDHSGALNRPWSGRNDPLFFSGVEVVQETLEKAGEFDMDLKPTLLIQSAYLLLFSAIERFASHSCPLKEVGIQKKLTTLAETPEFAHALKAVVKEKRRILRTWDKKPEPVTLDPDKPERAMIYYYQVRSTAAHAGKTGIRDHEILQTCTRELIEIFTRVRDDIFAKSMDDD
jgi:hypothetical protein